MAAGGVESSLPLVVIAGPTASGKTSLAVDLAEQFIGEIICADSRTVYKGLDIGTAKPTPEDRSRVPHWGLDLVNPGEYFSAYDFKKYADQKITEIRERGHVPFLVGGTGLYIDAVVFNYRFGDKSDMAFRSQLEKMSIEQLLEYCKKHNIKLPENLKNKRYIIRAIELNGKRVSKDMKPKNISTIVGISTDKMILRERIHERTNTIFNNNVVEEASKVASIFGWDNEAMTGNIYPILHKLLHKEISKEEAVKKVETLDWRLAKRQLTWLRRNVFINWMPLADARRFLVEELAKRTRT